MINQNKLPYKAVSGTFSTLFEQIQKNALLTGEQHFLILGLQYLAALVRIGGTGIDVRSQVGDFAERRLKLLFDLYNT